MPLPEPPEELQAKALADAYRDLCAANEAFKKETMAEAVRLGDDLIELLGGWLGAVKAYRASWTERFGNNLQGVFGSRLDGLVGPEILQYVRHIARHGAPSRQPKAEGRVRAKPHNSVLEHLEEAFEVWTDCHHGRVLL